MLFRSLLFSAAVLSLDFLLRRRASRQTLTRRHVYRATGRTRPEQQDPHARDGERRSAKGLGADIKFMQGMIMHHSQAVEMTDLLRTRSQTPRSRHSANASASRRATK